MSALSGKDTRTLLRHLEEQGARLHRTKKGVRVLFPNGMTTVIHWTNSDHRSTLNTRADVKRAGFTWPFDHHTKGSKMGKSLTASRRLDLEAAIELAHNGPTSIAELAHQAGVSEPTARKAMIAAGFIQRKRGVWIIPAPTPTEVPVQPVEQATEPVDAYPEIDRAKALSKVRPIQLGPETPPVNSWAIDTPAKLQAMADAMGLNIQVRVWPKS